MTPCESTENDQISPPPKRLRKTVTFADMPHPTAARQLMPPSMWQIQPRRQRAAANPHDHTAAPGDYPLGLVPTAIVTPDHAAPYVHRTVPMAGLAIIDDMVYF